MLKKNFIDTANKYIFLPATNTTGGYGFLRSEDYGETFQPMMTGGMRFTIFIFSLDKKYVFGQSAYLTNGGANVGMTNYRSEDFGKTFQSINIIPNYLSLSGKYAYSNYYGLSSDYGKTYTPLTLSSTVKAPVVLNDTDTIRIGNNLSLDGGKTWIVDTFNKDVVDTSIYSYDRTSLKI